jgi:hypothetical protein
VRPEIVDNEHVRVVERARRTCFLFEPTESVSVGGERLRQDLDGDIARETRVPSAVHLAHPASANQADDLVRAQAGAWSQGHGWEGV